MRGEYNTRQKREMLAFLQRHNLEHYTVDELVFALEQEGEKIGKTTAYRYLENLSEQGSVRKYQNTHGITLYQHLEDSQACGGHFHMMCKECGKLYHVDCDLMDVLTEHINKEHGFVLDPRETILVGICGTCRGDVLEKGADANVADHGSGCNHSI